MTCVLLLIMGSVPIPPTAFGIADIDPVAIVIAAQFLIVERI